MARVELRAAQARPCLPHRGGERAQPGLREQPRGRRGQSGRRLSGPGQKLPRAGVAGDPGLLQRDHSARGREAALQAVLGDHHGGAPVLVQAPEQPHQLVARHRVELRGGLVQQQQRGTPHHRRGDGHPLKLSAGEGVRAPVEEMGHPERQRRLLHRPCHRARSLAGVLQRQLQLRHDAAHHHLRLRLLEDGPAHRGQVARAVLADRHPGHAQLSRGGAAVEVGHEAAQGADQRGLPRPGHAGQHGERAGLDLETHVAQRRSVASG